MSAPAVRHGRHGQPGLQGPPGVRGLRGVYGRTLADQHRSLIVWSVSMAALVGMYVAVWPSVRDQPSLSDFFEQMPETLRALFASAGADYSTPVGYVQVELLSFMGPVLVLVYAITAAVNGISGEEDHHTLDLLLANPVSRVRLVLERAAAMVTGVVTITATTAVALLLLGPLAGLDLPVGHTVAAMVHLALLGIVFGSLALALSAGTGHSTVSRGVPAMAAVIAYVVNGLAPVVSWLDQFQEASPFYQYAGHEPLRNGISWSAVGVAVLTAAVLVGIAAAALRQRDIRP